jgi:hypothetical protein
MSIRGSCLCGAVRYELTGEPLLAYNCHCSRCRKSRGGPFAANLFAGLEALRFTAGEDEILSFRPPGAERFTNAFCRRCGASMPWRNAARGLAVVPMGSLDDDPGIAPGAHIFVDSKAPWFTISDDLPRDPGPPGSAASARS